MNVNIGLTFHFLADVNIMEVAMLKIIIDSREPAALRTHIKRIFKDKATFEEKKLEEGDYLITDSVVVERKRIDDLYHSILDGRLKSQVCRLTTEYAGKHIVIFVHGSIEEYAKEQRVKFRKPINTKLMFSALAEVMCSGIMILWVEDQKSGTDTLINYLLDIGEGKWMVPFTCDNNLLLAKMLKINRAQVNELLGTHKTIVGIAKATPTALMKVKGIGEKKATYIKKVLNE